MIVKRVSRVPVFYSSRVFLLLFAMASTPIACGCDDCDGNDDTGDVGNMWIRSDCVICGQITADGRRRCGTHISPLLRDFTSMERGHPLATGSETDRLGYCGSCREHNLLGLRPAAVVRARDGRASRAKNS